MKLQAYGNPIFIERLLMLMTEHDLTQKQLAAALDRPRQEIADWLYEGNVPADHIMDKIARMFDVTVDYLLGNSYDRNIYRCEK